MDERLSYEGYQLVFEDDFDSDRLNRDDWTVELHEPGWVNAEWQRYVDDERFARAFVKDKIRYNKWGRRKVQQALWQKHISEDIQQEVLDEIDDNEYLSVLRPLLKQKRKSTKAQSDYELNQKLARFALGRGFTFDIIRQCLDVDDIEEEEDEGTLVD